MTRWFCSLAYYQQALLATLFTWGVTALGASLVCFFRSIRKGVMDSMLGFSAGIMTAASFWSLLLPASEMAEELGLHSCAVLVSGFLSGGLLLFFGDKVFMAAEKRTQNARALGAKKRSVMLVFSITLHNIPEGLCIGVAFGSLAYGAHSSNLASACLLALGIGLQNFPEGAAVSLPLRREGASRRRAFFWGQLSGAVEPAAGVAGALLVTYVKALLPFCLSFAAGAMIYVVAAELVPESSYDGKNGAFAFFSLVGFALMMFLDMIF